MAIRSNPGKAARAARARDRGAWRDEARNDDEYKRLVRQLEAPGASGRQGRLEQTYALEQRLGRLQRRGVREAKIGRVTYRLNPQQQHHTTIIRTAHGYQFWCSCGRNGFDDDSYSEASQAAADHRARASRSNPSRRRSNPRQHNPIGKGELIDVLLPVVALVLLVRSGRLKIGN